MVKVKSLYHSASESRVRYDLLMDVPKTRNCGCKSWKHTVTKITDWFVWRQRQWRCHQSGWSGQGRTTFQRVVGLVLGLQKQSEDESKDETIGQVSHASLPLPCVYAFLVIVPVLLLADQEPSVARLDCIGTQAF